ncbi:MAG: hypothetical protein WC845_02470 [Candidatus Staskawiczbacteria bacterium]|jgi:hypothetical protein
MLAIRNRNTHLEAAAIKAEGIYFIDEYSFLKIKTRNRLDNQMNGRKYTRKKVNGPKTNPRAKIPKLGKIMIGRIYFFGRKIAAENKQVLTNVPTNHCGPLSANGMLKDKTNIPIKIKVEKATDKFTGRLRTLSLIQSYSNKTLLRLKGGYEPSTRKS